MIASAIGGDRAPDWFCQGGDARALSPLILHVPIDSRTLLRDDELELIGRDRLSAEDLGGYLVYLEHMGVPEDERGRLVEHLVALSLGEPRASACELPMTS